MIFQRGLEEGTEGDGNANGVVAGVFDVGKVDDPAVLELLTDHGFYLRDRHLLHDVSSCKVYRNVGDVFGCEFGFGNSELVLTVAEAIFEDEGP